MDDACASRPRPGPASAVDDRHRAGAGAGPGGTGAAGPGVGRVHAGDVLRHVHPDPVTSPNAPGSARSTRTIWAIGVGEVVAPRAAVVRQPAGDRERAGVVGPIPSASRMKFTDDPKHEYRSRCATSSMPTPAARKRRTRRRRHRRRAPEVGVLGDVDRVGRVLPAAEVHALIGGMPSASAASWLDEHARAAMSTSMIEIMYFVYGDADQPVGRASA